MDVVRYLLGKSKITLTKFQKLGGIVNNILLNTHIKDLIQILAGQWIFYAYKK